MASSSKRKRTAKNPHAAEYEIVRPRQDAAQPSATSRTVTFDRNSSGRLGQHTEIAEVEISAEDLAALAQDPEFSSLPDDETLNYEYFEQTVQEDDNEVEPIVQQVPPAKVKKVKQNIFAEWLPFRDTHVHELTQHEGWADLSKRCIQCLQAEAAYKCDDCFGPTHWNGNFWQSVPLIDLGLRVQLGHNSGPCAAPRTFEMPLTVYHTNGAHLVNVSYCECNEPAGGYLFANQLLRSLWFPASLTHPRTAFTFAVLKQFHHLTLQGKTTAYDFYNSLVHATDNTGLKLPPKRYNKFMMVMRWWRHIKMLKRAGHGHDPAGVVATEQGSLAVECPACPHDGHNLPANWKWLPIAIAWIYTLYLAMDANFRLKL
ncbi:hypothetical protein PILCRDRAFT_17369 [Piloderma croceum F 1598]|uniref:CxC2-like cysteine cluster KDZ transposase-associated domain-containing protein n=1 Tax=Piloderma croceum (strain F 1598) TaxID=765440 RepID=A0A0C3ETL0_PILCF|nr:hypothetical protein PILCRDRAFT_17369 [Piloderma croceum F 1598]